MNVNSSVWYSIAWNIIKYSLAMQYVYCVRSTETDWSSKTKAAASLKTAQWKKEQQQQQKTAAVVAVVVLKTAQWKKDQSNRQQQQQQ